LSRDRFSQIGVDRLVRIAWLEKTLELVLAGNDYNAVKTTLQSDLKDAFRTTRTDVRSSLDKTISILMRVWLSNPDELQSFRIDGTKLIRELPKYDKIPIHWGMIMSVYPFWAFVASQVGRLLRLQETASIGHIQRRVREKYGEREIVSRCVRFVLRSFLDWGVINKTSMKGVYTGGDSINIDDARLISWLVEAALNTRESGSSSLQELINSPCFFPFRITPVSAEIVTETSERLDLIHHGFDGDLVRLRR
jgi:hypothetical protein